MLLAENYLCRLLELPRINTMIRLPIFIYHHVSESLGPSIKNKYQVSSDLFERQMHFLFQNSFRCLNLSEVITNLQQGKPQPERSFVLTFDDGYIDFYENASSILNKFGFTATIFVVVKPVEEGYKRYLSWQQMKELAQNHFTFGSHTLTHPRLTKLDNMTIKQELYESKMIIEDRLGLPVDLLAYPYGDSNERIQIMACEVGYQAACGVTVGNWTPLNLWRVPIVECESELTFYWKAKGGYYVYNWLKEKTPIGRIGRKIRVLIRGAQEIPLLSIFR
jgi:peptidoglycan/xylan/chitin deacetylase (PgdA/CDA1 family)